LGLGIGFSSGDDGCITYSTTTTPARDGNPNKYRFELVRRLDFPKADRKVSVVEINYPDCFNYKGNKILVYADSAIEGLLRHAEQMFTRGEPAQTYGWDLGTKFAPDKSPPYPPALWHHPKPGPIEDPFLREYWLAAPFVERAQSVFGFPDVEAIQNWFCYSDQLKWLSENGFGIAEYRSKMIKHGLRQSVMLVNQPYEFLGFKPLTEYVRLVDC